MTEVATVLFPDEQARWPRQETHIHGRLRPDETDVVLVGRIEVVSPGEDEGSDAHLAASVIQALQWDSLVAIENVEVTVSVTVSKGWVTLRAEVDWQFQKDDAEWAVRRLPGVRDVSNQITVRPRNGASPVVLRRKIKDAVMRGVRMDAEHVNVDEMRADAVKDRGS